jgi:prepilin-type N-terminal cleavage/methylation domain-containing protein
MALASTARLVLSFSDMRNNSQIGFTLIELSIVLIIIGLIIGGVLVGQDLISAATVRAQISQIEKFNSVVNTFRGKYGYLPGDIPEPTASQYGFKTRGQYAGEGDGSGILQGVALDAANQEAGEFELTGETTMFWADLTVANLVEGGFTAASPHVVPGADVIGAAVGNYFPTAKLGAGNYIYVQGDLGTMQNYYSISIVTEIYKGPPAGEFNSLSGMTVSQAYNIDKKTDDGLPESGRITAQYGGGLIWATPSANSERIVSVSPSPTTCYDDGGNTATTPTYSVAVNGGAGINCGLSFRVQ